jgi:ssDNA-binding Zn-finger/Zn-ribbon topoisomerase 1
MTSDMNATMGLPQPACPLCRRGMVVVKSAKGGAPFLGCTNFPVCKHAVSLLHKKPTKPVVANELNVLLPDLGRTALRGIPLKDGGRLSQQLDDDRSRPYINDDHKDLREYPRRRSTFERMVDWLEMSQYEFDPDIGDR